MAKSIQAVLAYLTSPISNVDTEIEVTGLNDIYGNQVAMAGSIMYATIEPRSQTNQEIISFTDIEVVSENIVRLTGVTRGLAAQPSESGTAVSHGANVEFILSNNPQFYDAIAFRDEDETITGAWGFDQSPEVPTPTNDLDAANKEYADNLAILGSPDASTTAKGISRLSASPSTSLGTVTVTIATPGVFTLASHGLTENDSVQFTTTGALPTGITAGVTYYVISAGLTANNFEVSATYGGSAVNTTGSQSGTHTVYKTTPVAVGANDTKMPTQSENDALVGAGGTVGSANAYETQYDTSNASTKTATTISFTASTKTIADSGNGLVTAGFKIGTQIVITGSASNNGTFTISSVAAGAIVVLETLVDESAGATVVMTTVTADKLLRLDSSGRFPAIDSRNLTNLPPTTLTYPLGESFTGATTPQPCTVIDDLFQSIFVSLQRLGTVSSGSGYGQKRALKIIPRKTVTSSSVWAIIGKNNSPSDNIRIAIQPDSAGDPSGTAITNGTSNNIAGSSLSSSAPVWSEFTFASAFTLTANTTYWVVIERTGSMSDTDNYWLGVAHDTKDYASFDGKSYVSNWSNGSLELPTIRILTTTGGSKSLWKTDADATGYLMRQCMGFCATTGSAGADGTFYPDGIVSGFSSLIESADYYASTTAGDISRTNNGMFVGEGRSSTQILVPKSKAGVFIELGIVANQTVANGSMANCIWMAPYDGELLFICSNNTTPVQDLLVTVADASNMTTNAKIFYLDDPTSSFRHTLTVPVRKGQFVKIGNTSAGSTDTITYIPRY